MHTESAQRKRSKRSSDLNALLWCVGVSFVLTLTFWLRWSHLPGTLDPDALQQLSFANVLVDAVRSHGEFPLWNPYFGGGVRWSGYVYNPGLSPISVVYLLFGAVLGIKVLILGVMSVSSWSMYLVCQRWLDLPPRAALVAALTYVSAFRIPLMVQDGNYDLLAFFLLPTFVLCLYGLLQRKWYGWLTPLCYLTALSQAKYGAFVLAFGALLFGVAYAKEAGVSRKAVAGWWSVAFVFGMLVSAVKLLPLLDLLQLDQVNQHAYHAKRVGYEWSEYLPAITDFSGLVDRRQFIGIGWFAALIALAGAALDVRRARGLLVVMIAGIVLTLGPNAPIDYTVLLAHLPVIGTMKNYDRYWNVFLLFSLSGLVGIGFQVATVTLNRALSGQRARVAAGLLALGMLATPAVHSFQMFGQVFDEAPAAAVSRPVEPVDFHHVAATQFAGKVDRYRYVPPTNRPLTQYYSHERGVGYVTWYGNFVFEENAEPRWFIDADRTHRPNPDYRGEIYSVDRPGESFSDYGFTYNTLTFEASSAGAQTVVLNFNYDSGWTSSQGTVVSHDGLLAVELGEDHQGPVDLEFRDRSFVLGSAISLFAAIAWLGLAAGLRRREDLEMV